MQHKVITKGNIESYMEGMEHAAIICERRKRGRLSSDAQAIRKEMATAALRAKVNHNMNIPLPYVQNKNWVGRVEDCIEQRPALMAIILGTLFIEVIYFFSLLELI